jgi:arginine utilization regulatory protein
LEHVIENLIIRTKKNNNVLEVKNMPRYIKNKIIGEEEIDYIEKEDLSLNEMLEQIEKQSILEGLKNNNWNVSQTARELGMLRESLIYRMKKYNIEKD